MTGAFTESIVEDAALAWWKASAIRSSTCLRRKMTRRGRQAALRSRRGNRTNRTNRTNSKKKDVSRCRINQRGQARV